MPSDLTKRLLGETEEPSQQPRHRAPEGVETVKDTPEVTGRRIHSKYVEMPGMESAPEETPIIRCGTCTWYRKEDAWCTLGENDYQCSGLNGCCAYWTNPKASEWKDGEEGESEHEESE